MIETNALDNPVEYHEQDRRLVDMKEFAARGGKMTHLRVLVQYSLVQHSNGNAYYDVSYIHGVLQDGTQVEVAFKNLLLIPARYFAPTLIDWASHNGANANEIGLLDQSNWSFVG